MNRLLVCNPAHYGVFYKINPWMDPSKATDRMLAHYQWADLMQLFKSLNIELHEMSGEPNLPDIVFTANAGTVWKNQVVLSNFKYPERQGEKPFYGRQFEQLGFEVHELPDELSYEGAGDALFDCDGVLWCGYGFRSDLAAHYAVRDVFSVAIRPLLLVDPHFYHLDTCFCPLQDRHALVYPPAFDRMAFQMLSSFFDLIDVPEDEAHRFACNAVCVDRNVVIPADCPITAEKLDKAGYNARQTPMGEFIKAGGACKCLTIRF